MVASIAGRVVDMANSCFGVRFHPRGATLGNIVQYLSNGNIMLRNKWF
jgi:hypothetical protein